MIKQIPTYRAVCFDGKRHQYCVCVFVLNEDGRLHAQLRKMQSLTEAVDVVVADGGSTDGSVAPPTLEALRVNTLLVKTGSGRLGAQLRMAFGWALDRGYDGVITMDGNDKDGPEAVPALVQALVDGADHVQGSRFIAGGREEHTPKSRLLAVRYVHAPLISWAAGFSYTDTTNGFRGYSARFLSDERVALFRDVFTGYELHYYLAIRAARLGFNVMEVPVRRSYPAAGPTPTKLTPIRGNLRVMRCLLAACTGYYDP